MLLRLCDFMFMVCGYLAMRLPGFGWLRSCVLCSWFICIYFDGLPVVDVACLLVFYC